MPAGSFTEHAVAAGKGEEGKGLVIEIEARVGDLAVEAHHGGNGCVRPDKIIAKIIERVLSRLAPRAGPAEAAGLAVGECHARDRAGAMRAYCRAAVEVDCLVV